MLGRAVLAAAWCHCEEWQPGGALGPEVLRPGVLWPAGRGGAFPLFVSALGVCVLTILFETVFYLFAGLVRLEEAQAAMARIAAKRANKTIKFSPGMVAADMSSPATAFKYTSGEK